MSERDWERERHQLMAFIFRNTQLCVFGGGKDGKRTCCAFGSPGCACDDEVAFLLDKGFLEEQTPSGVL